MTGSPKRANRRRRCVYSENNRRCVRDGDGDPPLCAPHQVLFAHVGKPRDPAPIENLVGVLGDLLSGQRVSRDRIAEAAQELFGFAAGGMAQGYYPDMAPHDPTGRVRFDPPNGFPWWPGQGARRRAPPDPAELERQQIAAARARARQVLGFAQGQRLSEREIKVRQRELAFKHHPDRGGNLDKMREVNAASDILYAELQPP